MTRRNPIVEDYLARVRSVRGVEAVRYVEECGKVTLFTLLNTSQQENVDRIYEIENEVLLGHPGATIDFQVFNLANLSREAVETVIPRDAHYLFPVAA